MKTKPTLDNIMNQVAEFSDKQFGKANKMPQENKGYKQKEYPANPTMNRGMEYR